MTNLTEKITTDNETIKVSVVSVQEVFLALNEYLIYLYDLRKRHKMCFNRKDEYDLAVLDAKIDTLANRVSKISLQLNKVNKEGSNGTI